MDNFVLCKPNRKTLCVLNGVQLDSVSYTPKFNDLDEITFTVDKYIIGDNGNKIVSQGYEQLHAFMEVYLSGIGYFQIKEPTISNDGKRETKTIAGTSTACELVQKDLVGFTVNKTTENSLEMLADNNVNSLGYPNEYITFYNPNNPQLSLIDLILEKAVGWEVGFIDDFLKNQRFVFDNINENIFSFLTKTLSSTARCIFYFDTVNKTISAYAEKHIGEDTGIMIAYRNLLNKVDIACNDDNIFTRLNVQGKDSLTFADINYGDTHVFNLDFYKNTDYMDSELIAKLDTWEQARNDNREDYISKVKDYYSYVEQISEIDNKVPTNGVLNNWDNMSMDELTKNQTYYNSLIKSLQITAQNTNPREGESVYTGNLDDYSPSRLKSDGTVDHEAYMADLDGQGKETYREIITYVLPNIQIAINNFDKTATEKSDYLTDYLTEWGLYGIVELKAKQSSYQDQLNTLKDYAKTWDSLSDDEKAAHGDNQANYTLYHDEYVKIDGYLDEIKLTLENLTLSKEVLVTSRDTIQAELKQIRTDMAITGGRTVNETYINWFTDDEIELINLLFHDNDYTNENILITSLDDFNSQLEIERDLYDDATSELEALSIPQYSFSCELDNLLNIEEFKEWKDDFKIGNFIMLEVSPNCFTKLRLISISYNPCIKTNDLTVEFSNMVTTKSGRNDFSYIFDKAISVAKNSITYSNNSNKDSIELSTELLNLLSGSSVFQGKFDNLQLQNISANEAQIVKLTADYAKINELDIKYATIDFANITEAAIENLKATSLFADYIKADEIEASYLKANFANIDSSNINIASIGTLFNAVGLIDRATIVDGHITGYLDAVEINANSITAGTLIADRILLKAPEGSESSGLLYAINNLGDLTSTSVDTIDGYVLTERTINADKIIASSITTNELDVNQIFANSAVLSTLTAQQAFINAISTNTAVVGASQQSAQALGIANTANENVNKSVSSIIIHYLVTSASSGVTTDTVGWNTTPQSMTSDKKYLWTYQTTTDIAGNSTNSTPVISGVYGDKGEDGADGKDGISITIKSTSVTYQTSSNGTTVPTSDWSATVPSVSNGQYLWTRTIVNYSDGKSTTSYSVAYKGTNGTNGTSSYTHIRYSVNSNGNPMVETPTDSTVYIGIYTGTSSTAPNSYTSYTWSRYTGKDGTNGTNGTNGKDGNGINSISYFYAVTSTQTAPSASNITSTTIPTLSATNKYLWQKEVIDFTDSSVADKTSVILIAIYGDKGDTGISVTKAIPLYYASNSTTAPSAPTSAITSTSTSANVWTTIQPAFSKAYPYIYVCTQVEFSNSTYSWSNVTIERSLSQMANWCSANDVTLFDGSKIYTGTVTADKISANAITAEKIATDAIKSTNYVANTSGSFLNLADGSFDSKYLKWNETGVLSATSGTIGGWEFNSGYLCKKLIAGSTEANDRYVYINTELSTQDASGTQYDTPKGRIIGVNTSLEGRTDQASATNGALYINADGSIYSSDSSSSFNLESGRLYLRNVITDGTTVVGEYMCSVDGGTLKFCQLSDGKQPKTGFLYLGELGNYLYGTLGFRGGKGLCSDTEDITIATLGNLILQGSSIITTGTISGTLLGNAATATKLATARTIALTGSVTGSGTFDGSGNLSIATTTNHTHSSFTGTVTVSGSYTSTSGSYYNKGALLIRENNLAANTSGDFGYAPRIGFDWYGFTGGSLSINYDGTFYLRKQDGNTRATLDANINGNLRGSSSTSDSLYMPRVGGDVNWLPDTGERTVMREYSSSSSNLPNENWYHILANRSTDISYGSQLAIGMTTNDLYYRCYNGGSFSAWHRAGVNVIKTTQNTDVTIPSYYAKFRIDYFKNSTSSSARCISGSYYWNVSSILSYTTGSNILSDTGPDFAFVLTKNDGRVIVPSGNFSYCVITFYN